MTDHLNKQANDPANHLSVEGDNSATQAQAYAPRHDGASSESDHPLVQAESNAERRWRPRSGDAVQRSDAAWAAAAGAYIQAQRGIDAAVAAQLRAKEMLVALTQHPREQGCGVAVTMSQAWREMDSSRVNEVLGVDLERHYGRGCVGATVRINGPY